MVFPYRSTRVVERDEADRERDVLDSSVSSNVTFESPTQHATQVSSSLLEGSGVREILALLLSKRLDGSDNFRAMSWNIVHLPFVSDVSIRRDQKSGARGKVHLS